MLFHSETDASRAGCMLIGYAGFCLALGFSGIETKIPQVA